MTALKYHSKQMVPDEKTGILFHLALKLFCCLHRENEENSVIGENVKILQNTFRYNY